jgi:hypothetical protein
VRGGKTLARLASGFVFLLANPEFSHLASWRVVIRTPLVRQKKEKKISIQLYGKMIWGL